MFKVTTNGILTALSTFAITNGSYTYGGLASGNDGNFYGTTGGGGVNNYGTVFKVTTNGILTTLISFAHTNGATPESALTFGNDGSFYGTTYFGGNTNLGSECGTVFKISTNGDLIQLVNFTRANGANPCGTLALGSDGSFYGTTYFGGNTTVYGFGYGTIFKVTTNGVLTTLAAFTNTNGAFPNAGLTAGSDGNFYGTTIQGGTANAGTVFKIATNGVLTMLYSFNGGTDGSQPSGRLALGQDGNFYGTTVTGGTNNYGTVFKITTNGVFNSLISFAYTNGSGPYAGLTLGNDGNFYGTTSIGGSSGSMGTVFKLTMPTAPPPALGITTVSNFPVVIWSATDGNHVLQTTTNLTSGNWVTLTNGIPFTGIMVTNVAGGAAFFRLQ